MLQHDPDTLANLAVDAFGDYIKTTVQNRQPGVDIEWMKWFSVNVHEALGNVKLPSASASEVTTTLLRDIDRWTDDATVDRRDIPYCLAMSYLTSAVVHPAVTHLNFSETETYYTYRNVHRLFSQVVTEMNMLKELQLQYLPHDFEQFSFPNLQELNFSNSCNDKLLELLLAICGNIRKLDANGYMKVTDAGVQFLVKFKHLEKVNIMHTIISAKGLTQLLTDLSKNTDSEGVPLLKSLGCNVLGPQQLELLVNNFQNLVKLELKQFSGCCDISLFRNLKNLQSFTIASVYRLEEILQVIGPQLKQFKLSYSGYSSFLNLSFVSKYCPSLVYLNLDVGCLDASEIAPHPNFKTLKVVDVTVKKNGELKPCDNLLSSILSQCTNVTVLKVKCSNVNANAVATAMLQNNPLEHLEELHWWNDFGKPLLPEVGRQIVSQCKNLRVMYGNIWWSRRRSRKPWFNGRVYLKFCYKTVIPTVF